MAPEASAVPQPPAPLLPPAAARRSWATLHCTAERQRQPSSPPTLSPLAPAKCAAATGPEESAAPGAHSGRGRRCDPGGGRGASPATRRAAPPAQRRRAPRGDDRVPLPRADSQTKETEVRSLTQEDSTCHGVPKPVYHN
ncbi:resuscitation-promoting factor RpfA-like [Cervus elaphus]|uniref:resuscitation-promoting factor RpfA-like n=1 Tax=Cervus elaphus TaxID=9860 RepID=UPI001CC2DF18|nr:resuscitation-promoting factor RpfA-like [Cervus elaphus]